MKSKTPLLISFLALACLSLASGVNGQTTPTFTTLHRFTGANGEGSVPQAGLILGADGNFYGTTNKGGTSGNGTFYRLSADGKTLTPLHGFTGASGEGLSPNAAPLQGSDGAFYGVTSGGGANSAGTIYRLTADGKTFTTLYSFPGSAQLGSAPNPLIQAKDGAFYGTTAGAGTSGLGTIYRLSADGKTFTILYSFSGANGTGDLPAAALVQGSDGAFYGTTQGESDAPADGTVFRLTADGKTFTILHVFNGTDNYAFPNSALVQGGDGAFYGTTQAAGTHGVGMVYRVTADGKTFTNLHSFSGGSVDGSSPYAALLPAGDGTFYGTTRAGGTGGYGTVFQISGDGKTFKTVHTFTGASGDGQVPLAALTKDGNGNFYGTTDGSGSDLGTVFELIFPRLAALSITRTATAVTVLYSGSPGATYQPQSAATLTDNPWTSVGPLVTAGSDGSFTYTDTTQPQPAARFYRAVPSP